MYTLACVHNGDAADGEPLLQALRELGTMVTDLSERMAYCEVRQLFDTRMPAGVFRSYWKVRYLAELSNGMIDLAIKNSVAAPSDISLSLLRSFGGNSASAPADSTVLGDRSMGWKYSLDGVWSDPSDDEANIQNI